MLTGVSPVLLVADIDRSVAWWRERLGFECTVFEPDFSMAERDGLSVFLALAPSSAQLMPNRQVVDKMWNVYFRVDDVDALYAEVQERGAEIEYSLYDAPYGMREFGVQDPDGHDIGFGQPIGG